MIEDTKIDFVNEKKWVIPFNSKYLFAISTFQIIKKVIDQNPLCSLIYSDEDFISQLGNRSNPEFKTAWNRELLWSNPNYINFLGNKGI